MPEFTANSLPATRQLSIARTKLRIIGLGKGLSCIPYKNPTKAIEAEQRALDLLTGKLVLIGNGSDYVLERA